jgi:Condensation domain/Phosphopantetheine attachment site
VLGFEPDRSASFFDAGGDSVRAVDFVAAARDAGFELALVDVFSAPTIRELVSRVRPAVEPVGVGEDPSTAPLSLPQEYLLRLEARTAPYITFVSEYSYEIEGPLDDAALEAALDDVARAHPALRTTIRLDGPEPAQVLAEEPAFGLEVRDVADEELLPETDAVAREAIEPDADPLWRVTLLRSPRRRALVVCVHHIVVDGWAMGVFFRALSEAYAARRAGAPPPARQPWIYAEFAREQQARRASGAYQRDVDYWVELTEGHSIDWSSRRGPGRKESWDAVATRVRVGASEAARIAHLAQVSKTSAATVIGAVSSRALAAVSGDEDVVTVESVANRDARNANVIGFYSTGGISRVQAPPGRRVTELAAELWEQRLRSLPYLGVHFEDVAEVFGDDDPEYPPVLVSLFNERQDPPRFEGCEVRPIDVPRPKRLRRMLNVSWWPAGDGYDLVVSQQVGTLVDGTAEAVAAAVADLLRSAS